MSTIFYICQRQAPFKGFLECLVDWYTPHTAQYSQKEVSLCDSEIGEVWITDADYITSKIIKAQATKTGKVLNFPSSVRDVNILKVAVRYLYLEEGSCILWGLLLIAPNKVWTFCDCFSCGHY